MGQEVEGDCLGDEFKGYIFKITGGNDKQGFTMKQGVLVNGRVRVLMKAGADCYRARRTGERKRKSVRGCIVGPDIAVLSLAISKKGESDIPGLTDEAKPNRLGPKRAANIVKFFGLDKKDDVRKYVVKREITREGKKTLTKAPKIQRLITPARLRRKRIIKNSKKERWESTKKQAADYEKVYSKYIKEKKLRLKNERREAVEEKRRKKSQ